MDQIIRDPEVRAQLESVQSHIESRLNSHVGQPMTLRTRKQITESVADSVVEAVPGSTEASVKDVQTCWQAMSWRDKLKWYLFNRWRPEWGNQWRATHTALEQLHAYLEEQDQEDVKADLCPRRQLPLFLQPHPREVLLVDMYITCAQPIDHIHLDLHV